MIDECGKTSPLVVAGLPQRLISHGAGHDSGVEKKIRPRFENDGPVDRRRWQDEVLRPTRCCGKTRNYAYQSQGGKRGTLMIWEKRRNAGDRNQKNNQRNPE